MAEQPASPGRPPREGSSEQALQLLAALSHQPEANVPGTRVWSSPTRLLDHARRDFGLGMLRAVGQLLDPLPIRIAGLEVHARVEAGGILFQDRLHAAGSREEFLPRDRVDHAEERQGTRDALRLVERLRNRLWRCRREGRRECRHEPLEGRRDQLETHEAQHRREGPQLRDREGTGLLVRIDEADGRRERELEVGAPKQAAREREYARQARFGPGLERGEACVEGGRQIPPDQGHRSLDEVVVVDQPLGRLADLRLGVRACDPGSVEPLPHRADLRPHRSGSWLPRRHRMPLAQLARGRLQRVGRDVRRRRRAHGVA